MNKRGDLSTIIIAIVFIFALGVAFMIFSKVFLDVTGEMKMMDLPNSSIDTIEHVEQRTIPLLDYAVLFLFFSIVLGMIIASIYLDVHPALMVLFIIIFIIAVFLAGQFSGIFTEISSDTELSSTASQFTFTNALLGSYFPVIVLAVGIIIIIILYGKSRNVGEV